MEAEANIPDLNGRNVLITRPREQAQVLAELVKGHGGVPYVFPTLEINYQSPESIQHKVESLLAGSIIIFISVNAVKGVFDAINTQQKQLLNTCKIAAVGMRTKQALERVGMQVILFPDQSQQTSDGLLAHPQLHKLNDQLVTIVRAQSGREKLRRELQRRGAKVSYIQAYTRRLPNQYDSSELIRKLKNKQIDITLLTSYDAFSNLCLMLGDDYRALLSATTLIAPSERVANQIRGEFPTSVRVADNATNNAMLRAIV